MERRIGRLLASTALVPAALTRTSGRSVIAGALMSLASLSPAFAQYVVTETTDDGSGGTAGTLSNAILQANATGGTITFNLNGGATTITQTGSMYGVAAAAPLTINGGGGITIDAGGFQAFTVNSGSIEFQDLTIANASTVLDINASATFTLSSGILQLGDGGNLGTVTGSIVDDSFLIFDHSNAAAYGGVISGGGLVEKRGSGTLTLSGFNAYSGATTVSAGTLQGGAASSFNALSDFTIAAGATLDIGGFSQEIGSLAGAGIVTNSGAFDATLYVGAFGTNTSVTVFSGVIENGATNATTLEVETGGKLILTGTNTYTGGTIICSCATLQIGNDTTTGSILGDVSNGATLIFNRSDDYTFAGNIYDAGGGVVIQEGTGILTLSGSNDYAGGTFINAGTILITTDANLGDDDGVLTLDGGTLKTAAGTFFSTFDLDEDRNVVLGSGGGTFDVAGGDLVIDGVISGAGALTVTGSGGIFEIYGVNTYQGGTIVTGGAALITEVDDNFGDGDGDFTLDNGALWFFDDVTVGASRTVTLGSGGGTVIVDASASEIAGTITGSGSLTVTVDSTYSIGGGVLYLTGINDYSGGTILRGDPGSFAPGAIVISDDRNLGAVGGDIDIDTGGIYFEDNVTLNVSRSIYVRTGLGAVFDVSEYTVTIAGDLIGDGGLGIDSTFGASYGTLILTNDNASFSGDVEIAVGTLQLGDGGTAGALGNSASIVNGDTLAFNRSDTLIVGAAITDFCGCFGGIVKQIGTGVTVLEGANTYTGGTTISAGTLQIGGGGLTGSIVGDVANDGALAFNRSDTVTFSGAITGSGSVTQAGSGILILTGANNYSGGTIVASGTLSVVDPAALGTGAITTTGSVIDYAADGMVLGNAIILSSDTTQLQVPGAVTATQGGDISETGGARPLEKTGTGTLILTGNNSYTGDTTVTDGVLRLGSGASLGGGGLIIDGGEFDLNGGTLTLTTLSGGGGTLNLGSGTLNVNNAANGTLASNITGTGSLNKDGAGIMTLSGDNSGFSGNITIAGGTISFANSNAAGTGTITTTGSVIDYADGVTLSIGITIASNSTQLQVLTGTATQAGFISESGGSRPLEKIGAGTLILTTTAANTGITTITAGTLQLGNGGTGGSLGSSLIQNDATLVYNRSDDVFFFGQISGSGSVVKNGSGTLTLHGFNSYTGATLINAGTFRAGNNGLNSQSDFTIAAGGTLDLMGLNGVVKSLSGAGTVTNSNPFFGSLLQVNSSGSATFSGVIQNGSGPGIRLTKTGAGTLTLTGENTYTGETAINAGILQVGNGGATGSVAGNIVTQASLVFNRSGTLTYGGVIFGSGTMTKTGTGTLILTGASFYSGGTAITSGTLQIGNGGTTGSITGNVINNGTLAFNRSDNISFTGAISGTGAVTKSGAGTLTLTGTSTYNGATSINAGTLFVQGSIGSSSVTVASGATLGGNGTVGATTIQSGGMLSAGNNGIGALTVNGNLTLASGSAMGVEVSPGSADLITVNGNASLGGSLFAIFETGVTYTPTTYTLISTTGTVSGAFSSFNTLGIPTGYRANVIYGASSVVLDLGYADFLWKANPAHSDWNTASNWENGLVPVAGTTAEFGASSMLFVTISTNASVGTIQLNSTAPGYHFVVGNATLSLSNGIVQFNTAASSLTASSGGTVAFTAAGNAANLFLTADSFGTITFAGTADAGAGAKLFVNEFATVDFRSTTGAAGNNQVTTGSISGISGGRILLGANTLTTGALNSSTTFGGVISGTGGLVKTGNGTLILSGANTYTGGTTISAGTLQLGNGNIAGSVTGNIVNNATLVFNPGNTVTYAGVISGTGGVRIDSGEIILTANNSYTGGTTVAGSNLQLGNGGAAGSVAGNIVSNGFLRFNRSDSVTFSGVISGSGSLTQLGAGTLILTGANTYTDFTSISAGTLQIGNGGTSGSIASSEVLNNGALVFNRSDAVTFGGGIIGAGTITKTGGGTLILTGDSGPFRGVTTISAGILQLGNGGTDGALGGNIVNNAILAFNRSNEMTIATVISGTGAVQQNGTGTTILTGANTYTGGTTVNAGKLQIGNGGSAGSVAGNIVNNATMTFNRTDNVTFNGVISGTGRLVKDGSGHLFITSAQTYAGGTTITNGNLHIADGGSVLGDILNNFTLNFNRTDNFTFAGVISGTGAVVKSGAGIATLTAANTYAGATLVQEGTLQIGSGGTAGAIAGNATVSSNAVLAFNRSDNVTYGGAVNGAGAVAKSGAGTLILAGAGTYTGGTTISAGMLQLGNGGTAGSITGNIVNDAILAFNRSNDLLLAGSISGSGSVQQNGTGTTTLTGVSTYGGATTVNAGTLVVNGSITSNVILAGGALKGTGSIGGLTAGAGSTVAPGNSIGTLNVGSVTFAAGSFYETEVNSVGQSDLLNASGTASLNGTVQVVAATGTYAPVTTYRILNAGSISGTFASVTSNIASLAPSLSYSATAVDLTLRRTDVQFGTDYGTTPNQIAAGGGVSAGGAGSALYAAIAGGYTASSIGATLDGLSGEIHASIRSAALEDSRIIRNTVRARLASSPEGTGAWAYGFADSGTLDSDGNAGEGTRQNAGLIAGVDFMIGEGLRLGLGGAYAENKLAIASRASVAHGHLGSLLAYVSYQSGALSLNLGGDYGWGETGTVRTLAVPAGTATADRSVEAGSVFAQASYDFGLPVIPYAGITHVSLSHGAFAETGGIAALSGAASSDAQTYSMLGFRAPVGSFDIHGMSLTPRIDIGWSHAFDAAVPLQRVSFPTLQGFTVLGTPIGSDTAALQLGFDLTLVPGATLSAGYDATFSGRSQSHAVRGGLTWRF
ncbi:MAG TPA: autotransporter-associated beta strand repeat-containing protein [Rhizomicrobium sp.]|nr:autotransporter-associated beta strand repeat-containing protein [Rhizomicrobium sp.]